MWFYLLGNCFVQHHIYWWLLYGTYKEMPETGYGSQQISYYQWELFQCWEFLNNTKKKKKIKFKLQYQIVTEAHNEQIPWTDVTRKETCEK